MASETSPDAAARRFIELGVLLFLLGLLTGFGIPLMESPRMGVSSHLEGVLNGMFLVLLGLLWHRVALPPRGRRIAAGLAVFGTFANWLGTLLAALWGAGGMTPIAGGGTRGTPLQEALVGMLLLSLSVAMVGACVLVLFGLVRGGRKRAGTPRADGARAETVEFSAWPIP